MNFIHLLGSISGVPNRTPTPKTQPKPSQPATPSLPLSLTHPRLVGFPYYAIDGPNPHSQVPLSNRRFLIILLRDSVGAGFVVREAMAAAIAATSCRVWGKNLLVSPQCRSGQLARCNVRLIHHQGLKGLLALGRRREKVAGSVSTTEVWLMSCVVSSLYACLEGFFSFSFLALATLKAWKMAFLEVSMSLLFRQGWMRGRARGLIRE
jgi:hypothetical protein